MWNDRCVCQPPLPGRAVVVGGPGTPPGLGALVIVRPWGCPAVCNADPSGRRVIGGMEGPVVVLSAETAALMERCLPLKALRVRVRGHNQRVAQELLDLREVAMSYIPRLLPEAEAESAEVAEDLGVWLRSVEAADLVGITDRAIRDACVSGRLVAHQISGGAWRISRQSAMDYRRIRSKG
jgi:hypothetical protein